MCARRRREDLAAALARLPSGQQPRVVTFTPHVLAEVWSGIREIGAAAEHPNEAQALAHRLEATVAEVAEGVAGEMRRPRVLCLEWFGPPYYRGRNWVQEMVRLVGGAAIDTWAAKAELCPSPSNGRKL